MTQRASDFDFLLPEALIAQQPAPRRDGSRLFVLDRRNGSRAHHTFADLPAFLRPGDLLVLNDSKVLPARLRGINPRTGGAFEVLLLEEHGVNDWWVMLKPGRRARPGTAMLFKDRAGLLSGVSATVAEVNAEGHRRLHFRGTPDILGALEMLGEVPLPPYIRREPGCDLTADLTRYQTVYARQNGSVAAPTAGLHFTPELLRRVREHGVQVCSVTLHVSLGTFAPVKHDDLSAHVMHEEPYELSAEAAALLEAAQRSGRRIVAVGTTSVRVLETVASHHGGRLVADTGRTRLFIMPPWRFQAVGALLTNFHLPRSTLLMLVSAFAAPGATTGRDLVLSAYAEAVRQHYRFFSYGDAMLII